MRIHLRLLRLAALVLAVLASASAQTLSPAPTNPIAQPGPSAPVPQPAAAPFASVAQPIPATAQPGATPLAPSAQPASIPTAQPPAPPAVSPVLQSLLNFQESDVKFALSDLMDILEDRRHEGWVLAAYPDPKTSHPLIGAGFSLDLPARDHPQRDPLNPNLFAEPSSAELWQAAGLDPARLAEILDGFNRQLSASTARDFRRSIPSLAAQISDEDATKLVRIAVIQSIVNAKAYCRNFDRLTASQQMALTQLVYQMGVNLEEFTEFLSLINQDTLADSTTAATRDAPFWKSVQLSLEQSQWARLYRARAIAVVAMLDPKYPLDPSLAERRVGAVLRPAVVHRRRGRASASTQLVSHRSGHSRSGRVKRAHSRAKKKA